MRLKLFLAALFFLVAFPVSGKTVYADAPVVTDLRLEKPDHVTVGDHVRYVITMDAASGTAIALAADAFPPFVSLATSPQLTARNTGNGRAELVLTLEVAAFAPGPLDIPPIKLRYREPNGNEGDLATSGTHLDVESVLDPSEPIAPLDLKPQAEMSAAGFSLLWPVVAGLLVATGLVVGLILARRRARGPVLAEPEPVAVELGPEDRARGVLDRAGVDFAAEADFETYYATLAVTVRTYLTERFGFPAFALTTRELQSAMARGGIDRWQARITGGLLEQCDAVVYARYRPAPERADADLTAAYEIVEMSRPEAPEPAVSGEAGGAGA